MSLVAMTFWTTNEVVKMVEVGMERRRRVNVNDYSSRYWRERAEESRTRSEEMRDPDAKATMMRISQMYEHLAELVARREKRDASP